MKQPLLALPVAARLVALRLALVLAMAALFGLALAAQALAADGTAVDVASLWAQIAPSIAAVLVAGIGVLGGWVLKRLGAVLQRYGDVLHVDLEATYRDSLHSAAETGVNLALSRIGTAIGPIGIDLKSQILAEALRWVIASVPDAIAYLGLTPDRLGPLVEAKLGALLTSATAPAAVAPPAPPAD